MSCWPNGCNGQAKPIAAFDDALDRAGVTHTTVVYPGAPHSFFDRKQEQFAQASQDAWRRTLGFLGQVGAAQPT